MWLLILYFQLICRSHFFVWFKMFCLRIKLNIIKYNLNCISFLFNYSTSMKELAYLASVKKSLKISFMGNDDFSIPSLSALHKELTGKYVVSG